MLQSCSEKAPCSRPWQKTLLVQAQGNMSKTDQVTVTYGLSIEVQVLYLYSPSQETTSGLCWKENTKQQKCDRCELLLTVTAPGVCARLQELSCCGCRGSMVLCCSHLRNRTHAHFWERALVTPQWLNIHEPLPGSGAAGECFRSMFLCKSKSKKPDSCLSWGLVNVGRRG